MEGEDLISIGTEFQMEAGGELKARLLGSKSRSGIAR